MKKKGKQRTSLWLVMALIIGLSPIQAQTITRAAETEQTEDVITYDAAEFEPFKGRTKEEAARKYVEQRYISPRYEDTDPVGIYESVPAFEPWKYEGELSEDTIKNMTGMCNYYRWLAGSEEVGEGTNRLQKEAFNSYLESETKILENTMYCWGETPLDAIKRAMSERYISWNILWDLKYTEYILRKKVLRPDIGGFNMGFYEGLLALSCRGTEEERKNLPFYSFPSQGYMPNDLLDVDSTAWSVWIDEEQLTIPTEYDSDRHVSISKDISVTVTHRETGQKFERSMDQKNAFASSGLIHFKEPAEGGLSVYTGTYDVEVTGLLDAATEKPAKLCYTVTFFDPSEYLISTVKEVSIDGVVTYVMPQQMATPENIEKLTAILPEEVTVTGKNGRDVILPVKEKWRYDEAESCWKNSVDASKLPPELTDPDDVLSDFSIACKVGDNQGLTFEMNWVPILNYTHPTDGRGGEIVISRNPGSAIDSVSIYQITRSDETYTGAMRYDTKSEVHMTEDRENNSFTISTAYFLADTGDYVAVGYEQGGRTAWLSDTIIPMLVTNSEPWQPPTITITVGTQWDETAGVENNGGNDVTYSDMDGNDTIHSEEQDGQEEKDNDKTSIPKVAKVKKYKVRSKKKGFVLMWEKSSKVSGYQVQISTKRNFKGAKKTYVDKSKNRYHISKLKPNKKYYIRIRAYQTYQTQAGDKKKSYGKWVVKSSRTKR